MESGFSQVADYSSIILFTVVILILSFVVYKWPEFWRNFQTFVEEQGTPTEEKAAVNGQKDFPKYTACVSPDCVRCKKYQDVRLQAKAKLKHYMRHNDSKSLTKVILALGDQDVSPRKFTLQAPNVFFLPGLSAKPWWDDSRRLFEDDIDILSKNFYAITKEFESVFKMRGEPGSERHWSQNDTESGQWNIFCFYNQGCRIDDNCKLCPNTASTIEKLPHFMKTCIFGNAMFSILQPNTVITEHYGPCNLRIRCHLGLKVPPGCTMTVANESKSWKEGECMLFDDSFLHAARHDGTSTDHRVVLLLDMWHPYLTKAEKTALEYVF